MHDCMSPTKGQALLQIGPNTHPVFNVTQFIYITVYKFRKHPQKVHFDIIY